MFFSRGKNQIQNPYTFKHMYRDYIKDKKKGDPYFVTYSEYVDICSMYYKAVSKSIIEEGERFRMPFAMGSVYVLKHKTKDKSRIPIDWKLTIQEGKRIYNFNEHSDGYGYTVFWTKPYRIVNKFLYRLVFTRTNKRTLARLIKQRKVDFFEK